MSFNLRGLANRYTQIVNPNRTIPWLQSSGYTTDPAGKRTPAYVTTSVQAQIQAVSGSDLKHVDGLNITGVMRSVYLFGDVQSIVRQTSQGGDLLQFAERNGGPVLDWLVVSVIETWFGDDAMNGWCHVVAVLQVSL